MQTRLAGRGRGGRSLACSPGPPRPRPAGPSRPPAQPAAPALRPAARDVLPRLRDVPPPVARQHAQREVVEEQELHDSLPLLPAVAEYTSTARERPRRVSSRWGRAGLVRRPVSWPATEQEGDDR